MSNFVHLHNHTQNSRFDGFTTVEGLVKKAKSLGMSAVGLTDHGTFAGAIEFLKECRKHKIKPILGCMPPNSLIYTRSGVKKIKDIVLGDFVLTHNGNFKKVISLFKREHTGDIYDAFIGKSNIKISLTEEHPVFVKKGYTNKSDFYKISDLQAGYKIKKAGIDGWNTYASFPCVKLGDKKTLFLLDYLDKIKYTSLNGLLKKNKLSKFDREIFYPIPIELECDYNFGVVIGFYLAEGSFTWKNNTPCSTVFTHHCILDKKRRDIVDLWCKSFSCRIKDNIRYNKGSGVANEARIDSVPISEFLLAFCGCHFDKKVLHNDIFNLNEEFIRGLLFGIYADAKSDDRREFLKISNQNLLYQIKMLLSAVDGHTNIIAKKYTDKYNRKQKTNYRFSWNTKSNFRLYFKEENKYWLPIKKIRRRKYSGYVYNFEVEDDHSYVSHISLHNCETYLCRNHLARDKNGQPDGRKGNRHLNIFAKNYKGYQNLCALSQEACVNGLYYDPRIDFELLEKHKEGLIVSSACLSSVVNFNLLKDRYEKALEAVGIFQDIFKDDFYLEMMYHGIDAEAKILPDIQRLSKQTGAKILITNDSHYTEREDAEMHEKIMCISSGKTTKDPKRIKFPYGEFYLKSSEEMKKIFGHVSDYMLNTLEVAEKCDYSDIVFVEDGGEMLLPKFEISPEFKSPQEQLSSMVAKGMIDLKLNNSPEHVKRVNLELSDLELVWKTNRYPFATYFLIVHDIFEFCKKRNISAGIRGSGYGSLVLKVLGISEGIDPLEHGLLWERFLGFDDAYFISDEDLGIEKKKVVTNTEKQNATNESASKDASEIMFDRYT